MVAQYKEEERGLVEKWRLEVLALVFPGCEQKELRSGRLHDGVRDQTSDARLSFVYIGCEETHTSPSSPRSHSA